MFSYWNFFAKKTQDRNFNIHLHCLMYSSHTFLCVCYAYLVHILHVCSLHIFSVCFAYSLHYILCIYFMYSSHTLCCVYTSRMSHVFSHVRRWLWWKTVMSVLLFFSCCFLFRFFSKLPHHTPNFLTIFLQHTFEMLIQTNRTLSNPGFLVFRFVYLSAMKPSMFMLLTYTLATGVLLLQGKL